MTEEDDDDDDEGDEEDEEEEEEGKDNKNNEDNEDEDEDEDEDEYEEDEWPRSGGIVNRVSVSAEPVMVEGRDRHGHVEAAVRDDPIVPEVRAATKEMRYEVDETG